MKQSVVVPGSGFDALLLPVCQIGARSVAAAGFTEEFLTP